jgi:hypothetical protein
MLNSRLKFIPAPADARWLQKIKKLFILYFHSGTLLTYDISTVALNQKHLLHYLLTR